MRTLRRGMQIACAGHAVALLAWLLVAWCAMATAATAPFQLHPFVRQDQFIAHSKCGDTSKLVRSFFPLGQCQWSYAAIFNYYTTATVDPVSRAVTISQTNSLGAGMGCSPNPLAPSPTVTNVTVRPADNGACAYYASLGNNATYFIPPPDGSDGYSYYAQAWYNDSTCRFPTKGPFYDVLQHCYPGSSGSCTSCFGPLAGAPTLPSPYLSAGGVLTNAGAQLQLCYYTGISCLSGGTCQTISNGTCIPDPAGTSAYVSFQWTPPPTFVNPSSSTGSAATGGSAGGGGSSAGSSGESSSSVGWRAVRVCLHRAERLSCPDSVSVGCAHYRPAFGWPPPVALMHFLVTALRCLVRASSCYKEESDTSASQLHRSASTSFVAAV